MKSMAAILGVFLMLGAGCSRSGTSQIELSITTDDNGKAIITISVPTQISAGERVRIYEITDQNPTAGVARYRLTAATTGVCELTGLPTLELLVPSHALVIEIQPGGSGSTTQDVGVPADCDGPMELHLAVFDEIAGTQAETSVLFKIR